MTLSTEQIEELKAVAEMTGILAEKGLHDGATFLRRTHWKGCYSGLVRAGLVTWDRWECGTFGPQFAKVKVTEKGRQFLADLPP